MGDYIKYSSSGVFDLCKTKTWSGCLNTTYIDKNKEKGTTYVLHATGDCDLDGRKYIALPANLNINKNSVKTKYNLM